MKKKIFFIFLLFLPTQLGRHFWPEFSYVFGQRIDYLSPTIYLTDALIFILFFLEIKKVWQLLRKKFIVLLFYCFIVLLLSFFWLNFHGQESGLLLYKWLKLFELIFLVFWVSKNVDIRDIFLPLNLGLIAESFLAFGQFLSQRSLGFWILGERSFHAGTPGIALANWQGSLLLRPYATFPHPNVLAGYTLVVLILNLFSPKRSFLKIPTFLLGTLTIFFSFSRTTWIVWLLIAFFGFMKKVNKKALLSLFFLNLGSEAIWRRLDLARAALEMFRFSPIFGIGLGNFIPQLLKFFIPKKIYFLQPVHNIFLLVLAETGIIGLGVVGWGLGVVMRKLWQKKNLALLYSLFAIIFTGFFDHYWLTLPQTQLLLAIIVGLSLKN
jgi:O-antigen ligase